MNYTSLLNTHPIISDQISKPALSVVLRELEYVIQANTPGDITEFGCYIGTTTVFLRRLLDSYQQSDERTIHAYDSFAGLPPKAAQDASVAGDHFKAGELYVSKKQLLQTFHKAGLKAPIVHKGWFSELPEDAIPNHIAFAFLDGDFYDSILDSLRLVWPRLASGGVITIDDYAREALPGVERAVRDYFGDTPNNLRFEHHIGIIKKL